MVSSTGIIDDIETAAARVGDYIKSVEADLDAGRLPEGTSPELLNRALTAAKDATWSLERDRVRTGRAVSDLAGGSEATFEAIEAYTSIQLALSAIDRLEVRGRDSAGISVMVHRHGLSESELQSLLAGRHDPLFLSGAVEQSGEVVTFVYKAAAEIGALGRQHQTHSQRSLG